MHDLSGLVDTHFHSLQMEAKGMPSMQTVSACFSAGLRYAIDVGVSADDFAPRAALAESLPGLYLSVGLHPSACPAVEEREMQAILDSLGLLLSHRKVVAVGEIGLDSLETQVSPALQRRWFEAQLELAARRSAAVIVHNRRADEEILSAFTDSRFDGPGVMHCFSSDYRFACRCLDRGLYLSFAGNITYKQNHELRDTARRIPLDRLLLETDSPYLAPQPMRGRPCRPDYVHHTYVLVAELRGLPLHRLAEQVLLNARDLFAFADP